jgi:hypothetical protein
MFSNVACYSGGTGGVPSGSNVGLGNGVLMTDPAGTNAIFMPTLGQQFKIQWSVCNNGNAASGAVSVTLRQTSNALTVTDTSFNLSAVAAGTCVTQSSALMTVSSPGQWNWDVYLSGAYAGGLGYNFF